MLIAPTEDEVVKIFEKIIEKRHRKGFFALESFWDKAIILISSIPHKYMSGSIHRMFLRRRYWYTLVVYSAIREISSDFEVVKKGYELCNRWKSIVGVRSLDGDERITYIKENQFEELSNNTIDVRPHAILSTYEDVKSLSNFEEIKHYFIEPIFSIIKDNDADDPANILWAIRIWLDDQFPNSEGRKEILEDTLKKTIDKISLDTDDDKGYFKSPQAPDWDSTPELYCDPRTTLYSLMNLIFICELLDGDLKVQVENAIKLTSNWINARLWEHKNPYISALLLRYKMLLWEKSKTKEDTINLILKLKDIDQQWRVWRFVIRNIYYKNFIKILGTLALIIGLIGSCITIGDKIGVI